MGVAIDFDGTILDTAPVKSRLFRELGLPIPPFLCDYEHCIPVLRNMIQGDAEKVYDTVAVQASSEAHTAVEGALEGIAALAKEQVLYLVTHRGIREGDDTVDHALGFLDRKGVWHYFQGWLSSYVAYEGVVKDKVTLCKEYDLQVLIDDNIKHFRSDGVVKVYFRPYSSSIESHNGLVVTRSWPENVEAVRKVFGQRERLSGF